MVQQKFIEKKRVIKLIIQRNAHYEFGKNIYTSPYRSFKVKIQQKYLH